MANGVEDDALGSSLSISGDGNTIVAGSPALSGHLFGCGVCLREAGRRLDQLDREREAAGRRHRRGRQLRSRSRGER